MGCDMCGRPAELCRAVIEDVELNVCESCAKFGKIVGRHEPELKPGRQLQDPKPEKMELIVDDFAGLIKKKREELKLTQKEFAQKINEKESVIHKIETGGLEPSLALARKLEKILKVRLVEEHEETHEKAKKSREEGFTIGDFIKIK